MAEDTANNEKVVQRSFESFEAANERAIRDDLGSDFVVHGMPPGIAENADGLVELAKQMKAGIPDGKTTIEDMIAGDDKVTVRFTHSGTHRGELFGVPASNRTVSISGIEIYRLADGKIMEYWGEYNMFDLFGPPPGTGSEAPQQS
jgi:steroid delta-isomerase-like uncharacterized protein